MVSVIIPVFNRAHTIEDSLNSLLNQTDKNWECLLIDDGSIDKTELIISKYLKRDHRFHFFKRPTHRKKGPSTCRNIGIENAKGDYIIFLDSDDILAPFCIEQRVKAFDNFSGYDFLVFKMKTFSDEIPVLQPKEIKEQPNQKWMLNFIELKSSWQVTSPIYKREIVQQVGGFEEELNIFEDLILAIRTISFTNKFKVFNNIDCFYRNNENYHKKHNDISYNIKIVDSFYKVLSLYKDFLFKKNISSIDNITIKKSIYIAYKSIFNSYVVKNAPVFKDINEKIINQLNAYNFISKNKFVRLLIVNNFLLRFYRIKGLGLFRFINLFIN